MINALLVPAEAAVAPIAADTIGSLAPGLVLIPLLSAIILLLGGRRFDRWGHWLGLASAFGAATLGLVLIGHWITLDTASRIQETVLFNWIKVGDFSASVGMRIDPLSLTFVGLVTFVGSLIHLYSVAYMSHDTDRRRFFAYLNFFIAAMLMLVLGNSYLVLFVGWEGVGLASYLLIGFWNHVPEYATAAKKAFVMNRVGDMGLLIAMMIMVAATGSVAFTEVSAHASKIGVGTATAIGIFLLVAACGKSAQFPLQAWLGDAMAGPTPVSALIHAATMVTAGVYLVVRSGAIYVAAPTASLIVAIIGAITLVFGAVVGCAKDDMKKVLAASTMSQIGYMMLGAGLGPIGWTFAIFHLLTHGFFKAQLFLGAGSVMHAMGDQVNIRRFGALAKVMKITWASFAIGWLAILGIPPFSGFWSKDRIIEAAFVAPAHGSPIQAWIFGTIALLGAGVTAFYMSRLFFMMFYGKARWTTEAEGCAVHPHESSPLMTIPLIVLSIFSIGLGGLLTYGSLFEHWLAPVLEANAGGHIEHHEPVLAVPVIMAATIATIIVGVGIAWKMYVRSEVSTSVPAGSFLTHAARKDLFQDTFNETVFMRPGQALAGAVSWADRYLIDGLVNAVAAGMALAGKVVRISQTGKVRTYAAYILGGTVFALVAVIVTGL